MSVLAKLQIKNINRRNHLTPAEVRRNKLLDRIKEQLELHEAVQNGREFAKSTVRIRKNEQGDRVRVNGTRNVKAWFFKQDDGFYVQCKYGSKALMLSDKGNSVFVKAMPDVKSVLDAFANAAKDGELDQAIEMIIKGKKNNRLTKSKTA